MELESSKEALSVDDLVERLEGEAVAKEEVWRNPRIFLASFTTSTKTVV